MWAQGMDDFKPLRTVPGLAEALMTLGAPNSVAAQGGAPRPAMDVTKGSFFYKDKSGVRLGPSVLDTMKIMWDFKEIDENTEVFAEGLMEGFEPVRKVPELHRALATGQAAGGGLGGAGAGAPGVTTPVLPAFPSFDTSVKADGLGLGGLGNGAAAASERQKVELAATRSLLEATKTELRAKEATIKHMATPGKGGAGSNPLATPRTAVSSAPRGAKSPWTPPPPRPTGDLTESEYDEDDDYQDPGPGQEAANGVVESTNPIYAGKAPAGRAAFSPTLSPPAGSRSRRGPSPTRSGRAGPQLRSLSVLDEPEAPQTLSQRIKSRQNDRGGADIAPQEPAITSLPTFSLGGGAPEARTGGRASPTQATQQSIYGVFKSQMRTLEEEHHRCRDNLEREYESRRTILNKALVEEDGKLKKVQEQYQRVKGCMDQDLLELEKESRRLAAVEQSLAEARSRVDAEVDVMRLKL